MSRLAVAACLLFAATAAAADWHRFLGPDGDGSSPETGIIKPWPKAGLKKLWECPLGTGYSPPSVAGGKLYTFDRVGDDNRLECRDARTGKLAWTSKTATNYVDSYGYDPGPRACPVIDGDRVYAYAADGVLACVNAATGKEVWKLDLSAKYHAHQNFFGVGSAPLVHGDLLLVAVGGSPPGRQPFEFKETKGNGSAVVALEKLTGVEKWRVSDELASYTTPVVRTIGGKPTGLYFARGGLLGFDPANGKELFQKPYRSKLTESVNAANPVVVGDEVLLSECYENGSTLLKISGGKVTTVWADGTREREDRALASHWCTPIYADGFVYGCDGRNANDAELRCVEWATGTVKWVERRTTRCTLLKVDGHLISLGEQGELRLIKLNPAKYDEVSRWEVPGLGYPAWAPPVLSNGVLYVRGKADQRRDTNVLMAFELIPPK
jgi:outer membrane protein assembly factor BamB